MIQYRANGRTRRYALGLHGVLTPDQARKLAARKLGEVREGGDPSAERKARARASTVAELAERYLAEHAHPKKRRTSIEGDERIPKPGSVESQTKYSRGLVSTASTSRFVIFGIASHICFRGSSSEAFGSIHSETELSVAVT